MDVLGFNAILTMSMIHPYARSPFARILQGIAGPWSNCFASELLMLSPSRIGTGLGKLMITKLPVQSEATTHVGNAREHK